LQELRKQVRLSAKEKREIIDAVTQDHKDADKDADAEQEKKKALTALEDRTKELYKIIQRLYEDNAAGKINDDRLNRMLATYEAEQKTITEKTNRLTKKESNPAKESRKSFFQLLEGITEIDELTPDLLHRLIDHIEIGQGTYEESGQEGERGHKHQVVKIFYRFVGNLSEQAIA
jgi:regulator of replication initiation timing